MATIYARATTLLALIARASAHGAGAWKDPNHYVSDSSLAGLRFISEKPAHTLNVVGTDDGTTWWSIKGSCSGKGMTQLKFDFSPKGGPSDASATWAKSADGVETATFCDTDLAYLENRTVSDPASVARDSMHYVIHQPKEASAA